MLCLVFLVAVMFVPESPVYLVSNGDDQDAGEVIKRLGQDDQERLEEIKEAFSQRGAITDDDNGRTTTTSWIRRCRSVTTNPDNVKPFVVGVILMSFFQVGSS